MDIKSLGKSIKHHRKNNLHLTQERLAELLDVSTHYVYELERGSKIPSLPVLISIAELFNTSIDGLLNDNAPINDNDYDELDALIKSLSPDKRKDAYEILCFLLPRINH